MTRCFEIMRVDVRVSGLNVQIFVCNRPPKPPLDDDFALYESLSALVWEKASVLAGDFNCPDVD